MADGAEIPRVITVGEDDAGGAGGEAQRRVRRPVGARVPIVQEPDEVRAIGCSTSRGSRRRSWTGSTASAARYEVEDRNKGKVAVRASVAAHRAGAPSVRCGAGREGGEVGTVPGTAGRRGGDGRS
jgi:hypothetical protein